MIVNGKQTRTIWLNDDGVSVDIIDQRKLPFEFVVENIRTSEEMAVAIKDMHLRGAPLIGAAAGYGLYLACLEARSEKDPAGYIQKQAKLLNSTRPTAVNLKWALDRVMQKLESIKSVDDKIKIALEQAKAIADEDADICKNIGLHGVALIEEIARQKKGRPVQVLTHCNAGALATVDHGTATSPVYEAHRRGIPLHVWVDETRPRNQGKLTAWELAESGVPHTVVCDNTGGHLMQHGMVDIVIVGTDRTTANGDAANKIGTYLKALAAADNGVPFYVALPSTTIDWELEDGVRNIPIETRSEDEVLTVEGEIDGKPAAIRIFSPKNRAVNYGFDVTPARLIKGFITEKGICRPEELRRLFGIYVV